MSRGAALTPGAADFPCRRAAIGRSADSRCTRLGDGIEHWARNLSGEPLAYLTDQRGIAPSVLIDQRVGLDTRPISPRLTFPMFDDLGRVAGIKYRVPKPGAQMLAPTGRDRCWPLYPWPKNAGRDPLIICAGELDALCALSHRLGACSVTLGAGYWDPLWTYAVNQRRVLLVFDNDERVQARKISRLLAPLGVSVQILDLRKLGMREPKADLSDYFLAGGTADQLVRAAR